MSDAMEKAQERIRRLEEEYEFECISGPLTLCADWHELKDALTAAQKRIEALEANIEGLILEAMSMADGRDEEKYIEKRLRAALDNTGEGQVLPMSRKT